jgi:hypothetical protein
VFLGPLVGLIAVTTKEGAGVGGAAVSFFLQEARKAMPHSAVITTCLNFIK